MSKYKEFVELMNEIHKATIDSIVQFESIQKEKFAILDAVAADIERQKRTGVLTHSFYNNVIEETTEPIAAPKRKEPSRLKTNPLSTLSSLKENPMEPSQEQPQATISQVITNNITTNGSVQSVVVKAERLTTEFIKKYPGIANMPIKQEKTDLPLPTNPPVRQTRKRKDTLTAGASSSLEQLTIISKDSEIQITHEPVDTVNFVKSGEKDSERAKTSRAKSKRRIQKKKTNSNDTEGKTEAEVSTRVIRSRTKDAAKNEEAEIQQGATVKNQKLDHSSSIEDCDEEKKTDAAAVQVKPQPSMVMNKTAVVSKPTTLNETVVETPKYLVECELSKNTVTRGAIPKRTGAEFQERKLRRKEAEALSKKETLIQAQVEDERLNGAETRIKAQHMREALKNGEEKGLQSAERQTQEKIRQTKAEIEGKLLRQREKAARKRTQILKKVTEKEHEKQEKNRLEETSPPYLKYETPLLPTQDCYDSDDSNASRPFSRSHWQKEEALSSTVTCMTYIGVQTHHFFCNGPATVDLKEIFPSIECHKLKRTSSAIWDHSDLAKIKEEEDTEA